MDKRITAPEEQRNEPEKKEETKKMRQPTILKIKFCFGDLIPKCDLVRRGTRNWNKNDNNTSGRQTDRQTHAKADK